MKVFHPMIRYIGSKGRIAYFIAERIDRINHKTYVEPFGGGLNVFFARKRPVTLQVVNDINGYIVNLYQVIRNPKLFKKFKRLLEFTPYSRLEHNNLLNYFRSFDIEKIPDVRAAYVFYYTVWSSPNGSPNKSFLTSVGHNHARDYRNTIKRLKFFHKRLQKTVIEYMDARDVIRYYDSDETVFYIDPPYITASKGYSATKARRFQEKDHEELLDTIISCKGTCIVSSERNELYDKKLLENGYDCITIKIFGKTMFMNDKIREESIYYPKKLNGLFRELNQPKLIKEDIHALHFE